VIILDESGIVREINASGAAIFGYEPREVVGQPVTMLMGEDDQRDHVAKMQELLNDTPPLIPSVTLDGCGRHRSGREVPIEVGMSVVRNGPRKFVVGLLRDVSARRVAEAEQARLVAALHASNTELDEFAHLASHDLKAPLRVIENAVQWLEQDLEPHLTDDTRETLELLRGRVRRMRSFLDDLLEHSRIGSKTGEAGGVEVSGRDLATGLKEMLAPPPGFTVEFTPEFEAIQVRQHPLQVVLINLISNAIKHHDRSDGRVRVSAEPAEAGFYRITVADDGPGIDPRFHDRIFGMFQTLRPRDEVEGSGMGLAIVRKHVTIAGGRIEVRSEGKGDGTRFIFTWPGTGRAAQPSAA